jgi:hypothetical protein
VFSCPLPLFSKEAAEGDRVVSAWEEEALGEEAWPPARPGEGSYRPLAMLASIFEAVSAEDGYEVIRLCAMWGRPAPPLVVEAAMKMGNTRLAEACLATGSPMGLRGDPLCFTDGAGQGPSRPAPGSAAALAADAARDAAAVADAKRAQLSEAFVRNPVRNSGRLRGARVSW